MQTIQPDVSDSVLAWDIDDGMLAPACDCVAAVDAFLEPQNGKLGEFHLAGQFSPCVFVRKIDRFGDVPPFVLPRFCPFCGSAYLAEGAELRAESVSPAPAKQPSIDDICKLAEAQAIIASSAADLLAQAVIARREAT